MTETKSLAGGRVTLHVGDCLDVLASLPENSVDAIVTDPPYGLAFMGKAWDAPDNVAFRKETWAAALRVLKPGGHILAFSGTRTYHRMACAIEDAGFEIRDMTAWVYGQGFPKSMDVSKAIDKAAGAERTEKLGPKPGHEEFANRATKGHLAKTGSNEGWQRPWMTHEDADDSSFKFAPATDAARQWEGWGTALKPSLEPVCVGRKPLSEKTVAANVLRWGTGALNIDASRVATDAAVDDPRLGGKGDWSSDKTAQNVYEGGYAGVRVRSSSLGRWPANLIHDGSPEVLEAFPDSAGQQGDVRGTEPSGVTNGIFGEFAGRVASPARKDSGSAARFFYCAKASKADRAGSKHPTVKPIALMRYLARLVTPPGGVVLDPFAGTGTTGAAALAEGFPVILIEREAEYAADIARRFEGAPVVEDADEAEPQAETAVAPKAPPKPAPAARGPEKQLSLI